MKVALLTLALISSLGLVACNKKVTSETDTKTTVTAPSDPASMPTYGSAPASDATTTETTKTTTTK